MSREELAAILFFAGVIGSIVTYVLLSRTNGRIRAHLQEHHAVRALDFGLSPGMTPDQNARTRLREFLEKGGAQQLDDAHLHKLVGVRRLVKNAFGLFLALFVVSTLLIPLGR